MKRRNSISRRRFIKTAAVTASSVGLADALNLIEPLSAAAQRKVKPRSFPTRELGTTGVKLPILQLGTSQSLNQVYDKVLHRSFREGVTVLDTALSYGWGSSHKAIANFIGQIGDRRSLWITSKSSGWDASGLIADVDKCLDQLKTDYLDLYLMHGPDDVDYLDPDYIKAGEKLRRSGKVRFFGFSNHGSDIVPMMHKAVKTGGIDAILFRYNFRYYGKDELNRALDACKRAGIGLIAMKTMGGVSSQEEKVVRFQSKNFSLAQAKLKSVWEDDRIDAICSEMHNIKEVRENTAAARSGLGLSSREKFQIELLAEKTKHLACLGCSNICEGCVAGDTPIADTLRYLMYHETYGKTDRARQLYQELPKSVKSFDDAKIAAATQACPQGINIAARLSKARVELA